MKNNSNALLWLSAGAAALLAFTAVSRRKSKFSFQNKVVVVTGGARGLGLVISRMLAEEGAKLAICSRSEDQLEVAATELREMGAEVLALPCDLTDKAQADTFLQRVRDQFGHIDVLVNNAGIIQAGPLENMELKDFEDAMNTHFYAPLYTMLSVVPFMKARGEGRIVNIASIGGRISMPHIVPYSASKFALVGLSEGFRAEFKKDGILVTTVNPGLFRSGSPVNIALKGQTKKEYAWFVTMGANLLTSSSVEHTAREVIEACRNGEAEVITNFPARILALANSLCPEITSEVLGLVNEFVLPEPTDADQESIGLESESDLVPEHLRKRNIKAALKNNEF